MLGICLKLLDMIYNYILILLWIIRQTNMFITLQMLYLNHIDKDKYIKITYKYFQQQAKRPKFMSLSEHANSTNFVPPASNHCLWCV